MIPSTVAFLLTSDFTMVNKLSAESNLIVNMHLFYVHSYLQVVSHTVSIKKMAFSTYNPSHQRFPSMKMQPLYPHLPYQSRIQVYTGQPLFKPDLEDMLQDRICFRENENLQNNIKYHFTFHFCHGPWSHNKVGFHKFSSQCILEPW